MKKTVSILIAIITALCMMFTVSAASTDSGEIDFGDLAGVAGDVDVDTYVGNSDFVLLRRILLGISNMQSAKTADVNQDGNIDICDVVKLDRIMKDMEKLYYAAGTTDVCGDQSDKTTWMYKVNGSGLYVREADIVIGDGNNVIEIAQLSDFHLMAMTETDYNDPVLARTFTARNTSAFQKAEANALKAMEYGSFFDKIYVTGDATDFLSVGSLELLNKVLGNSGAKVAMGNHEFRKVWFKDTVDGVSYDYNDTEPVEDRYDFVEQYWPNNLHYYSEVINGKVMSIVMNNGSGATFEQYYDGNISISAAESVTGVARTGTMDTLLAEDIELARQNGYTVLIFQHCPVSTGAVKDEDIVPITYLYADCQTTADFYNITGNRSTDTAVDKAVYGLITGNADVIKGVFNGHMHSHFYSEIKATTPDGTSTVIPQYTLTGNFKGEGCALKISVRY